MRLSYGRLILPRKNERPRCLRDYEYERASTCQALKIIDRICEQKRQTRRAPVLATFIEVVNQYDGKVEKLKAEIERLVKYKFIERTRTINYEAYRLYGRNHELRDERIID